MSEPKKTLDTNEQIAQRREKLAAWRETGNAFPNDFTPDTLASELVADWQDKDKETLMAVDTVFALAGRIMLRRIMGKASFCHIQDRSGRIQLYLKRDDLPEGQYQAFKKWDIGDIIGVKGTLFKTKTGELTLVAQELVLLTKALRPLPDKFHGLTDQEMRYRKRYVDLIMNEQSRRTFQLRSQLIAGIRQFFNERTFLEVETPMMQPIPGGAAARPFVTHHNALDMPLYLRIAPELYLKRLVVGGFERVYEINRNFRNEGLSTRHNPEFTMLEFYWAYARYGDLMDLTEDLLRFLAREILGETKLSWQGDELDFEQPFQRLSVVDAILHYNDDVAFNDLQSVERLQSLCQSKGINIQSSWGKGKLQIELFEATAEDKLRQPTFITDYPTEVSPLARRKDDDPEVTERFEFFVGGKEIANGFSELNDADDQAARFQEQVAQKDAGDDEAMFYDEDYIEALEYGLPPTAGEGIGIDRLVMMFTDSASIRDVLLFPQMRRLVAESETSEG